jgi:hypothetical protein
VRATEAAVRKLTSHAGIVVAAPPPPSGGATSNSHDRILIAIGAAVLVLVAAGVSLWRRRARFARGPSQ